MNINFILMMCIYWDIDVVEYVSILVIFINIIFFEVIIIIFRKVSVYIYFFYLCVIVKIKNLISLI